ncbi:thioredoxin-like protein [Phlyctochytrium arcticum]|nr:thioredoxin-like protein [Phlyctochytrium arcticum]
MRRTAVLLLLGLQLLGCFSYLAAAKPAVIELTDANFDELVGTGEWVVEFYAQWCGFCRNYAPAYEAMAKTLSSEFSSARVGKLDIDINPAISSRFMVQRLPSIYHIRNKEVRHIQDIKDADQLVVYVRDGKWRQDKPISEWFSPFSFGMRSLGMVGAFGQRMITLIGNLKQSLTPMGMVTIAVGTLLFMALLGRLLGPGVPQPTNAKAAVAESRKKR